MVPLSFGENLRKGSSAVRFKKDANGGNFSKNDEHLHSLKQYEPYKKGFPNRWGKAAHHLIPIGSLSGTKRIRKYLDKGRSYVSCDAGYGINGSQNGVWLISSGSKRWDTGMQGTAKNKKEDFKKMLEDDGIEIKKDENGIEALYKSLADDMRDEESEDPSGAREFLFATMQVYQRQFHDGDHASYSDFVDLILKKVISNIFWLRFNCRKNGKCKDKSRSPLAPHQVVDRLNHISDRLRQHLACPALDWRDPIFTSKLSRLYAKHVKERKANGLADPAYDFNQMNFVEKMAIQLGKGER